MKFRNLSIVILLVIGLIAGLGINNLAHASFVDVTLGAAGPLGLDLGIFVTGPTTMNASNSGTDFDTNLGLATGSTTNFSGWGTLTGILYKDPGATVQANIATQFNINGGITTQSLATAVTDVKTAATNAASLTADQTFGNIGGSALTINNSGQYTVIDTGAISITNPSHDLTIHGAANDWFIINVNGDISVTNGAILLSGGITPSHVLFNVEGTHDVSLSNSSSILNGTFLAPNLGQKITLSPGTVNGAIIGYEISTSSGPKVYGAPYTSPVPLPPSALLLGTGLVGLLVLRRRRG